MLLTAETLVFPMPASDLVYSAKKYAPQDHYFEGKGIGYTLIFAHNTSSCKEMWEPVIEDLWTSSSRTTDSALGFYIREMWSLEWQSHGQSALLNEGRSAINNCRVRDYGIAISDFVNNQVRDGRTVVAVGYSAGAVAWAFASLSMTTLPFASAILIEPPFVVPPIRQNDPRVVVGEHRSKVVLSRREQWNNMLEARTYLRSRIPWSSWDQTMFDVVMDHTLREVKNSDGGEVVKTCCSNVMERPAYGAEDYIEGSSGLDKMCASVPMHIIFGERPELVSKASRAAICDEKQGRKMKSIEIIPKTGHLVVHESPREVARSIHRILTETAMAMKDKTKL